MTGELVNTAETTTQLPAQSDDSTGDLVQTIDLATVVEDDPEEDLNAGEDSKSDNKGNETKADEKADGEKDNPEGDTDDTGKDREKFIPRERFDQVNDQLKELKVLVGELKQQKPEANTGNDPDFLDEIETADSDDLRDQFDDNPAEFLKKYGDALINRFKSTESAESEQKDYESRVANTIESFAKENEGFDELWESKEIHKYMDANPGAGPDGAFFALTKESREAAVQKRIDDAVAKATKKTEAKYNKLLKRESASLPGGPSSTASSGETPAELRDTNKHGGTVSAIASRILARRQAG